MTVMSSSSFQCESSADLWDVRQRAFNVAHWRRQLSGELAGVSSRLDKLNGLDVHLWGAPEDVIARLGVWTQLSAEPELLGDVKQLAHLYADVSGEPKIGLKLALHTKRQCPKLHEDCLGLRMICTYAGPGTLWAKDHAVNRDQLGFRGDATIDEANSRILKPGASLNQASVGDVLILKGCAWPGNSGRGAIHVSPDVKPSDPPRLLLVIDAVAPAFAR